MQLFGLGPMKEDKQPGHVLFRFADNADPIAVRCEVVRITPETLRVAVEALPPVSLDRIFQWNRRTDIVLELPPPIREVKTAGILTGIAVNYEREDGPPFLLDFDFPDLTEEEEQALRESNPSLVVV